MDMPHLVYPFISELTFRFFHFWPIIYNAATNTHLDIFMQMYIFNSLEYVYKE